MPIYEYTALKQTGQNTRGTTDAENLRAARQKLRSQGLFPTDIREVAESTAAASRDVRRYFQSNRVSLRELAVMTRQLATLVGAGLPLVSALQALTDQTDSVPLRRIIVDVREQVEEGEALAQALAKFPKAFPTLYINMVASGEASGTLDTVLDNLADYFEAQLELRRKVGSALLYPILMLIICSLVVVGLLVFVVPKIVDIFQKQGATLPLPTRITIGVSDFFVHYWLVVILFLVVVVAGVRLYYREQKGRKQIDALLLKLPIYGSLFKKVTTARVARTLGTLLNSGVGLLDGLDIAKNIVSNVHISHALEEARDGVREGRGLARELSKSGHFPPMLGHMIAVGEKSGELEEMLIKAGRAYENEVNAALGALTSLIEPMMMIMVGGIVLMIVISILLPMADLISVMQR